MKSSDNQNIDNTGKFRGGKKSKRDKFYGLKSKSDFTIFERWYHKDYKWARVEITSKEQADKIYKEWEDLGKPIIKWSKSMSIDEIISQLKEDSITIKLRNALSDLLPENSSKELNDAIIDTMMKTNEPRMWNACAIALSDMRVESGMPYIEELMFSSKTKKNNGSLAWALNEFGWIIQKSLDKVQNINEDEESYEFLCELDELVERKEESLESI